MPQRSGRSPVPPPPRWVTALFAVALWSFPPVFRSRFGPGIVDLARTDYVTARASGRWAATVFLVATLWDLLRAGTQERARPTLSEPRVLQNPRESSMIVEHWIRDFAYAARGLLRSPGFTVVTVATLALAIGANVAIFSVVDAVLLDPLPFPHSDRLMVIRASAPGTDFSDEFPLSSEFFVEYRESADLLEDIALFNNFGATLRTDRFAERVRMASVTTSFFTTLGATPFLGRLPGAGDGSEVVAISHWLWTTRFGADSSVVGRSMEIAEEMRTVIGVTGPDFMLREQKTALWIPIDAEYFAEPQPGNFFWDIVARVRPGVDAASLVVQLAPLAARLPERFGGSANYRELIGKHQPVVTSLRDWIVGDLAGPLWVLLGTMGIVLLIACANVANLFVVRSASRQRELAVRQALGAGRWRVVQGQMAEALLLAALGGAGAMLLAAVGVPLLLAAAPDGTPRLDTVAIDGTTLLFTAVVAAATAVVFGLAPSLRSSTGNIPGHLRDAGRGGVAAQGMHRASNALVITQTALALVLLVGSGLLVRSFVELRNVDPGYDTKDIFSFQVAPSGTINDAVTLARYHTDLMTQIAALPSVQSVGVVRELPLDESTGRRTIVTERAREGETLPLIGYTFTGGDYFGTMGIELLRGRLFDPSNHESNRGLAIVSTSAAQVLWPGEDPIGKRLRFTTDTTGWETVVGVVEDIHQSDFRESNGELIYFPLVGRDPQQRLVASPGYVVKTSRAATIAPEVRALVRGKDPAAPMYAVHTMESLAAASMVRLSFTTLTLALASALSLILGAVGLYGVLAYVVAQRTREIGLRMALGARDGEVRWMVVRQGARLASIGVALGLGAAVGVTRVLDSLLFGVGAVDASTYLGMSAVMLAVALLASYLPARRASSVDPITSLRAE